MPNFVLNIASNPGDTTGSTCDLNMSVASVAVRVISVNISLVNALLMCGIRYCRTLHRLNLCFILNANFLRETCDCYFYSVSYTHLTLPTILRV